MYIFSCLNLKDLHLVSVELVCGLRCGGVRSSVVGVHPFNTLELLRILEDLHRFGASVCGVLQTESHHGLLRSKEVARDGIRLQTFILVHELDHR